MQSLKANIPQFNRLHTVSSIVELDAYVVWDLRDLATEPMALQSHRAEGGNA
jgi:hypothetical protein